MTLKGQNVHDWSGHIHSGWSAFQSRDVQIRTSASPMVNFHLAFTYLSRSLVHFFSFLPWTTTRI